MIYLLLVVLMVPTLVNAQEFLVVQTTPPRLEWGMQPASPTCTAPTPSTMVQTSTNGISGWSTVATVPITTLTYNLPATANNLFYRVATACPPPSNIVQYVATTPPPTDPTVDQRLTAVETKNAAQDLALGSLATKDAAHDSSIGIIGSQLIAAEGRIATGESKNAAQDGSIGTLQGTVANILTRLNALENPPAPASNLAVKDLSADQVEITGLNCTKLTTIGTGLKRIITCVH